MREWKTGPRILPDLLAMSKAAATRLENALKDELKKRKLESASQDELKQKTREAESGSSRTVEETR